MNRALIFVLILACALLATWNITAQQPRDDLQKLSLEHETQRTQWEYKIEYNVSENKLNQLAGQGWELVAAASEGNVTGLYFKRLKS
jgi:hypothetical protein